MRILKLISAILNAFKRTSYLIHLACVIIFIHLVGLFQLNEKNLQNQSMIILVGFFVFLIGLISYLYFIFIPPPAEDD